MHKSMDTLQHRVKKLILLLNSGKAPGSPCSGHLFREPCGKDLDVMTNQEAII